MAGFAAKDVYCGVPGTTRGEATHLGCDASGGSDWVAFPCGRVAVVRSLSRPLECRVFALHGHRVSAVRISPDGVLVASGDEGGFVKVWGRQDAKQVMDDQVMAGCVRDLAFSRDGKFLVVCGDSRGSYAKAVKVPSGSSAGGCKGHTKRVVACDVAGAGGKVVITGSEDMTVGVFQGPPVNEMNGGAFKDHHKGFVNDLRFSPDGTRYATASSDRSIAVVDAASGNVVRTLEGHTGSVTGVAWLPCGGKLVSSSNDKTTRVWKVDAGECVATKSFGTTVQDMQVGVAYSEKAAAIVSLSLSGDMRVLDAEVSKVTSVLRGHAKSVVGLAVVGGTAYSADYGGHVVAWDVGVGPSDKPFSGKGPAASVNDIGANDAVVATVGMDGKIFVVPTETQEFRQPVTIRGGGICIAVPRKTNSLIACAAANEARIALIASTGDSIAAELEVAKGEGVTTVASNSDGTLLAVGIAFKAGGGEMRYAKVTNGTSLAFDGTPVRLAEAPKAIAFSRDDSLIAVGLRSRHVKMFKVGEKVALEGGGAAHTARVDAVCFDDAGVRVASGGLDGSICVWTVTSDDDPVYMPSCHRGGVSGIAFADDSTLLSCGADSCLRSWTL